MILIWSRFGFVALVLPVAVLFLCANLLQMMVDDPQSTAEAKKYGMAVGCLVSAVGLWPLGRWMNRTTRQVLLDPISNDPVVVETGGGHTMFWIPVQYWAFLWATLGLYWLVMK